MKKIGKIRVAVLMGGPSSEHEVSLNTGQRVLKGLRQKYFAKPVVISKNGQWPINFSDLKKNFDIAFIAMHGEYGEDGTVQKILEFHKIPFTGSDSRASRLGMDKIKSSVLFKRAGLNVPAVNPDKFPAVVKPVDRGSSVGTTIVYSIEELNSAVKLAKKYSRRVMRQEFIDGREITCGVLEIKGRPVALPPTEIIPKKSGFFDYRAKYEKGASREVTPPDLPKKIINKIKKTALAAHRAIGAAGFSRTDMILQKSKIYVLEINTIPGMTETSLLPQQAKAVNITFPELLDIIIMHGRERGKIKKNTRVDGAGV